MAEHRSSTDPRGFIRRVTELRQDLQPKNPAALAANTGAELTPVGLAEEGFLLAYWGKDVHVSYPEFAASDAQTGEALSLFEQTLLLYYFHTADGAPLAHRWISFSELPDGKFYNSAFQGYTGHELARAFHNELALFTQAAQALGGVPVTENSAIPGDAAFRFDPLPEVPLLVAAWQGDEDFPPSYQVLFDASASHYLPTDAYAILGSSLTKKLIAAKKALAG